jgi:hypothetical protein
VAGGCPRPTEQISPTPQVHWNAVRQRDSAISVYPLRVLAPRRTNGKIRDKPSVQVVGPAPTSRVGVKHHWMSRGKG